jgi:cytochrome c oxidase assembly protein subunit 15
MKKNIWVRNWLLIGVVLILFQIVIGGVTRLTGSGLSITKWEIVVGTLPPLNERQWTDAFDLYKDTPQYEKLNQGMTLGAFKFIYFWEYFHRLWARVMGLAFLVPFLIFSFRGLISRPLLKKLIVVFLLAVLVAIFGWIMVASGLIERPWVNAYKLSIHLGLAMSCLLYLFHTYLWYLSDRIEEIKIPKALYKLALLFFGFLIVQLLLGGIVSGMRAALLYPSWPDMNGVYLPAILTDINNWNSTNFSNYDSGPFMSALAQFLHRNLAYFIVVLHVFFLWRLRLSGLLFTSRFIFVVSLLLILQVVLGILTLLYSVGSIPVFLGVAHQLCAFLLLLSALFSVHKFSGDLE